MLLKAVICFCAFFIDVFFLVAFFIVYGLKKNDFMLVLLSPMVSVELCRLNCLEEVLDLTCLLEYKLALHF